MFFLRFFKNLVISVLDSQQKNERVVVMQFASKVTFLGCEVKKDIGQNKATYAFANFCDSKGKALELMTGKNELMNKLQSLKQFEQVRIIIDLSKKGRESDVFLVDVDRLLEDFPAVTVKAGK